MLEDWASAAPYAPASRLPGERARSDRLVREPLQSTVV